jgi:serine/threonine protein kinase/tetratricopeptide (TPR) repeat protein
LADLVEEYVDRLQRGEAVDPEDFVRQYPEDAETLRQLLSTAAALAGLRLPADSGKSPISPCFAPDSGSNPILLRDFRIVREIGRGGMGIVYEAEQRSLRRRVALKVLPSAATLDPRHLQRFGHEAQAAAQLHHGNIVPVFTVGCERGVHYYAMQLIDGRTVAALIEEQARKERSPSARPGAAPPTASVPDSARLTPTAVYPSAAPAAGVTNPAPARTAARPSIRDRRYFRTVAELGVQAADALDYAHQVGVVHRDIKPANLLVEGGGRLWVTDFGLALLPEATGLTQTGDMVGTLRYMSPEQTLGRRGAVDHRTDIYSLGVTLFELLTLRPAFPGKDRQVLLREIIEVEPPPPRHWNRAVPVDLETVVLKAMSKEPIARYPTARELADDLRRFLEGRPVLARPPSLWQRAGRWLRRHPGTTWAAFLFLVLVATASAISSVVIYQEKERTLRAYALLGEEQERTKQAYQETARGRQQLQRALNEMSSTVIDEWLGRQPSLTSEQKAFLERALGYYQELAYQAGTEPEVRAGMAVAHLRMGIIRQNLGQLAEAGAAYPRGQKLLRELITEFPSSPQYRRDLAGSCNNLGNLLTLTGRHREAESAYREALAFRRGLLRDFPTPKARAELAESLGNLAVVLVQARQNAAAESLDHEALSLRRNLVRDHPAVARYRSDLAQSLYNDGHRLRGLGRVREAEASLREALALRQQQIQDSPADPESRAQFAWCQDALGHVHGDAGRFREAEDSFRQALATWRQLGREFPNWWGRRWDLSCTCNSLGALFQDMGRLQEAESTYREALTIRQELIRKQPTNPKRRVELTTVQVNLGMVQMGMKRYEEAEASFREVLDNLRRLVRDFPSEVCYREALAFLHHKRGLLREAKGTFAEAEESYRKAQTEYERLAGSAPDASAYQTESAAVLNSLGTVYGKTGRLKEAEDAFRKGLDLWEKLSRANPDNGRYPRQAAVVLMNLAKVYHDANRLDLARQMAERAVDRGEQAVKASPAHPHYRTALRADCLILARHLLGERRHAEAVRLAVRLTNVSPDAFRASCDGYSVLARCVPLAAEDPQLSEIEREETARAYAEQARDMLRGGARRAANSAAVHNDLAWFLATSPNPVLRIPSLAVELALEATRRAPEKGNYWNTLGVAHYRASNWQAARAALEKSMKLGKAGNGADWFFLAMTAWRQGNKEQAREWFDKAVRWTEQNAPRNEELHRFRTEAAALLDIKENAADTPPNPS